MLDKSYDAPLITNDGVTIAKEIELDDRYENMGAQLVKGEAITTLIVNSELWMENGVLVSYPDREIYQKDIEEELNIRSASVSTLLKKMEAQDFIRREKVSYDDRLKKILPTSHTVEMKEEVERHIALLEKRLTAGIKEEELRIFSDVLKKMQENMELTERGNRCG